jgi:hypothetical protein
MKNEDTTPPMGGVRGNGNRGVSGGGNRGVSGGGNRGVSGGGNRGVSGGGNRGVSGGGNRGVSCTGGRLAHRVPAGLSLAALLTAGVLCLAACSGSPASKPAAAPTPTPIPTSSAASAPSTPASSPSPTASPDPSSATVTASAASPADITQFTHAAVTGKCGFTTKTDKLTDAKVTNNDWGSATVTAKNPQDQGNESIVFQMGTAWTVAACGSDFSGDNIPQNVLSALDL